jgi:hypothetical protein
MEAGKKQTENKMHNAKKNSSTQDRFSKENIYNNISF